MDNDNYIITWCPVCELQRVVYRIDKKWFHCVECDIAFGKYIFCNNNFNLYYCKNKKCDCFLDCLISEVRNNEN